MSPQDLLSPALTVTKRLNGANPRHRHNDCDLNWCSSTTFFDQLPWISLLDNPDQSGVYDIADLSQLDNQHVSRNTPPRVPGPGPVRSRKSSNRSSLRHAAVENILDDLSSWFSSSSCSDRTPRSPRTPRNLRATMTPSRVRFHNLLPVFSPARLKCEFDPYQFALSD